MEKSNYKHKIWGENTVQVNPTNFGTLRLKYCLEALRDVHGNVLEVGCGAGAFVRAIKSYRDDLLLTGVDVDSDAIAHAKNIDHTNKYLTADAHELPFPKDSFNAVIAIDVLEHLHDPLKAILEIKRILKKGGILYLSVPLEGSLWTIHGLSSRIGFRPKYIYASHIQQYSNHDIVKLLEQAGYKNVHFKYSGHLLQQIADFSYFSLLQLCKSKPEHTVEGYIENLQKGKKKELYSVVRGIMAVLFYGESKLFFQMPGLIGHFVAIKN
jgi:ubiquinone/menaquinone biosynthesis C-methylase UbiE